MARTPEGKVKDAVKAYLKSVWGAWFFMPVSNGMGKHGVPDFIVCVRGVFIGVECKAPGKVDAATKLQLRQHEAIRASGGLVYVVDSVDMLHELMCRDLLP